MRPCAFEETEIPVDDTDVDLALVASTGRDGAYVPPVDKRPWSWCFTVNNYTPADEALARGLKCRYVVFSHEIAPTTGTPHLQGYVYWDQAMTLSRCRLQIPRAIWFLCKGQPSHNIKYCTKPDPKTGLPDPALYERGTRPVDDVEKGKKGAATGKLRAKRIIELAEAGDMATIREEEPEAYLYKRQAINACFQSRSTSLKAITGLTPHLWVHGEPGAFKSVFAHTNWPEHYDKSPNDKWWCGYAHQDVVLLDDVGHDARYMATDYKRWLDRTPFVAQPKGSSMVIRPGRVVVTSNYTPEEIFNPTDAAAVRRRLSVVRLTSAMRGRIPGYERAQYYDPATGLAAPWPADDEPMPKPPAPPITPEMQRVLDVEAEIEIIA